MVLCQWNYNVEDAAVKDKAASLHKEILEAIDANDAEDDVRGLWNHRGPQKGNVMLLYF